MLKVTVADCENTFIGIFQTKIELFAIQRAVAHLQSDAHTWDPGIRFYDQVGPPWAKDKNAAGFLARPEQVEEDLEYYMDHEGTAWVYVEPVVFDTMFET